MKIAGLDEVARGCIVGPLVISGFMIEDERLLETLKQEGVKDSKKVSPKKRTILAPIIESYGTTVTKFIQPEEIDKYVSNQVLGRSLNYLEAIYMAKIIDELHPDIVYVDSPYVNTNRLWKDLRALIKGPFESLRIIPEHHADSKYIVVGAASIVAKVRRDEAVEILRRQVGDFHSGYPSDKTTRAFLTELVKRTGEKPDWVRKSWSSWDRWLDSSTLT